ncbi:MAG: tRNA (guanosine(37)-N1)-methyltransferase TrmD [Kofleriaceae bacterium]
MKISVITILPELVEGGLSAGVVARAAEVRRFVPGEASADGAPPRPLTVTTVNPRDFATDRHRSVDDTPYGGGPGMVMKPEPLLAAIAAAVAQHPDAPAHRVLLSPVGRPLDQAKVRALAARPHLVLVCGRYEGLDERIIEEAIDEEVSLGDYVLSGGELGALVVLDAVARLLPGVLGEPTSAAEESFSDDLLEYPQYTRPWALGARQVPEILASGNHAAIASWRRARSLERTARRRPELFDRHRLTPADRKLVAAMPWLDVAARTYVALVHHPVLDKAGAVVTSAVTNLDLHDIARSCRTFGLAGYFVVTPVEAQQDKVRHISRMWQEQEGLDHRASALELVRPVASLEQAIAELTTDTLAPRVVATSANPQSFPGLPHGPARALLGVAREDLRPNLLVFGTGWGLAERLNPLIEHVLAPVEGRPSWNHLSVRSAVAILLDRLFGLRELDPIEGREPAR